MAIRLLDPDTAGKIAAGEVVESPASVVKELAENALDAGATRVAVQVREGGCSTITVTDDGAGIAPEELDLAFRRHATSKIGRLEDLFRVTTLGFRGEALPSIAAVARVTLTTRRKGDPHATRIRLAGGKNLGREAAGAPGGTAVTVEDLFFNTPARRKFLRSPAVELGRISALVSELALARPEVSFTLESGGRVMLQTRGDGSLTGVMALLYGDECAAALLPLEDVNDGAGLAISGFLSAPYFHRASRRFITVIINGRAVKAPNLSAALERGYGGLLPRGRHPVAVLHLKAPPRSLDVNVHPAKTEVRFQNPDLSADLVFRATRRALGGAGAAPAPAPAGSPSRVPEKDPSLAAMTAAARTQIFALEGAPACTLFFPEAVPPAVSYLSREKRSPEASVPAAPAPAAEDGTPRLIGQFWQSYLAAQEGDRLLLVDQHAAHERILYHALIARRTGARGAAQLTIPVVVEIPLPWRESFAGVLPVLEAAGFILEPFGDNSYIIREVPFSPYADTSPGEVEQLFEELLSGEPPAGQPLREAVLKTVACHRAVKAGQSLSVPEMEELLAQWAETPEREYCPHGRPAVLQFTRRELEKSFRRTGN